MAAREFTTPVPRASEVPFRMLPSARNWERIAAQRRDHHLDLYKSGRWKHYYSDDEFLIEMRQAVAIADRWAVIAPLPAEREASAAIEQPVAA